MLLRAHELADDEEKQRWLDAIEFSTHGDSHATATLSFHPAPGMATTTKGVACIHPATD
jgi:hypothetical protein